MIYSLDAYLKRIQEHNTEKQLGDLHRNIYKESLASANHYSNYNSHNRKELSSILNCKNYIFLSVLHLVDSEWDDWDREYKYPDIRVY